MAFIHDETIYQEYKRWLKIINEKMDVDIPAKVSVQDVLRAHFLLVDYFKEFDDGIGGIGPKDLNLLISAVSRQATSFAGVQRWKNDIETAASLFYGLVKNHAFHDCNKRTALLTLLFNIDKIGRTPSGKERKFEDLTVEVATSQEKPDECIKKINKFISKNTRKFDKRRYVVTYRELNVLLKKFGFELTNAEHHFIDVVQHRESKNIFGKPKTKTVKITRIGFPGWNKTVDVHLVKEVRKKCKLTHDYQVDASVFFQNYEPYDSLITKYHNPLLRLADR